MANETVTDAEVEAVIAKLNSVDFTDTERSLLGQIFAAAAPGEVEGFGTALTLTPAQIAALGGWDKMFPPSEYKGMTPAQKKGAP